MPSGAVIDKVSLRFRWKAAGAMWGVVTPFYRQGAQDTYGGPRAHLPAEGWVEESWDLYHNPTTGALWTPADVNAGMEFGLRSYLNNMTPRVTQAYVQVTYRMPAESTVYIGGVYERKGDGSVTKYYAALGRVIAVRQVPAGGGGGTLSYVLADHLGTTVVITDTNGNVVATQHYYPYGGARSGGISQTDKLFTGQQQEPSDADLGLYSYKARFYSTALGRFVSADSVDSGFNRFVYVNDSPLRYNDPSGHVLQDTGPDGGCDAACGLQSLAATGKSSRFWLAFAALSAAGLPVRPSAVPKLERLVERYNIDADTLASQFLDQGERYVDTANDGNINIILPRPDGSPGYIRLTLNPEQNAVVSAGNIKTADFDRYLRTGRFTTPPSDAKGTNDAGPSGEPSAGGGADEGSGAGYGYGGLPGAGGCCLDPAE